MGSAETRASIDGVRLGSGPVVTPSDLTTLLITASGFSMHGETNTHICCLLGVQNTRGVNEPSQKEAGKRF